MAALPFEKTKFSSSSASSSSPPGGCKAARFQFRTESFATKATVVTPFSLLGKLSFVYESKEKMHHKQHKCCEKISAPPMNNTF
ncbi:hypothetical protein B5K11_22795 [Rhizobium leguminosarum bv. trifolii]|nr:hypothetical protein B5K11_22795 [Rhizobium leguminosarum bv. trifolii]